MIRSVAMAVFAFLFLCSGKETAHAETARDLLSPGSYLAVESVARSQEFYSALFGGEPVVVLKDFVAYDISGGWFALVSRAQFAPDSIPGTGAVPYIRSDDLTAVQSRDVRATGAETPEIIAEPGILLLKLKDPDGHKVEFYMLVSQ